MNVTVPYDENHRVNCKILLPYFIFDYFQTENIQGKQKASTVIFIEFFFLRTPLRN